MVFCFCDKFNKSGSDVHDSTNVCRSNIVNGRLYKYDNRPSPNAESENKYYTKIPFTTSYLKQCVFITVQLPHP